MDLWKTWIYWLKKLLNEWSKSSETKVTQISRFFREGKMAFENQEALTLQGAFSNLMTGELLK